MIDLSTATIDELLDELMSRHEVAVFIARPKVDRDYQSHLRSKGPDYVTAGLCSIAATRIGLHDSGLGDFDVEKA